MERMIVVTQAMALRDVIIFLDVKRRTMNANTMEIITP
jgi:hypothetical protein